MKALSVISPVITAAAVLFLLFTRALFSGGPVWIGIQIAAVALAIWARRSFAKGQFRVQADPGQGGLVSNGPYRAIRHPMYTSVLLLVWSATAAHPSTLHLAIAVLVSLCAACRVAYEEKLLRAHFPDYADYARRTRRVIPYVF